MVEKDIELVSIWLSENQVHSQWNAKTSNHVLAIIAAICDVAKKDDSFMSLLLGGLIDCIRGGEFSKEIDKISIDLSNFNNILKNTKDNG